MRRGHPAVGGWRGENQRHFRSGSGGGPHFRPPRPFSLLDSPRYPPPGLRPHRPCQSYIGHIPEDHDTHSKYDRNKYRFNNWSNSHQRPQDRNHHAQHQYSKRNNDMPYKDQSNYYKNKQSGSNVNSMGDVDHRQLFQRQVSPWKNDSNDNRQHFERRNYQPRQHRYSEGETSNASEYTGHRPQALNHYGDPVATINESDTFSRSVDDTVDIVRKRLLSRNEPMPTGEAQMDVDQRESCDPMTSNYTMQQERPTKKRIQRQKQSVTTNCDKMKNKIVNQLFKMDKVKIHKLMDNPSSSTKFEYAISSLITESQNSFHRHMRSVAEKSLCSSSSDFIQNDNNTIYEDTFMKQMQCILDPQDTILLEDIKPLVMAELNKVLQLDNFDPRFGYSETPDNYGNKDVQNYEQYPSDYYDNYPQNYHEGEESLYNHDKTYKETTSPNISGESHKNYYPNHDNSGDTDQRKAETDNNKEINTSKNLINVVTHETAKPWSESFVVKKEPSTLDERIEQLRRHSYESRRLARLSIDKSSDEIFNQSDKNLPLFETNAENVSDEEEDPFAELDNQYHVAVDPNFIEPEDLKIEQPKTPIPSSFSNDNVTAEKRSIKKEIENQFQAYINSPIKLGCKDKIVKKENQLNYERRHSISTPSKSDCLKQNANILQESSIEINQSQNDIERPINSLYDNVKSTVPSVARKRSIDQKPSHRKEKRKKSESSESESNKQILNKNIIINVTDCASGTTEKTCEKSAKSIFNLYFSKDNRNKDTKLIESKLSETPEKKYSDKYVKRKETPKKTENETKKKSNTSHSIVSPKDSLKSDSKTKFQTFDMFTEQPKKSNVYQAHRNTAAPVSNVTKTVDDKQCKTTKVVKKHVSIQVSKKVCIKETQTIPKRNVMRAAQTDPVKFEKSSLIATDPFERMKEIDLEIQALLQEKFKLYNSLESKSSCPKGMENLGMTVVNMPIEQPSNVSETVSEDTIVENFTSIPVEELEQLAFETIDGEAEIPKNQNKSQMQSVSEIERKSSESPTLKRSKRQKTKALNFSLLEQIIDDDRPLEDIISLDDLEATPTKAAIKVQAKKKKKPVKKFVKKKGAKNVKFLEEDLVGQNQEHYPLKECTVVIERLDLCDYLKPNPDLVIEEVIETPEEEVIVTAYSAPERTFMPPPSTCTIVEEALNDLQFDMLDVSEDIVIGEGYEKEEILKECDEKVNEVVTEEVVLNNCMSSESLTPLESAQSETQCKIYDFSADENLKRDSTLVSGNADAVLAIECIGNNFVAACLDGNVYHFTSDGTLLSTLRGSNLAVTCLTLVTEKYGTTVYTGSLDSRIRYYDLETGMEKGPECNVLSPIQTMDRAWDTIFVGTRTGFVLQFECKNNMLIPVSTVKFSEQSILSLRAMKEGPRKVLLVAARSENVTIKDALSGLLLRTLEGPKMTVYTLLYVEGRVYCGTSSHQIQVFDYTSGSHVGSLVGGKGAVAVVSCGGLIFAGCYDGAVYVFRQHDAAPFALFRGQNNMLLSLAVHDTKIIAGYKDRSLYIWKIPLNILKEMIL